jgi:cell division protein FtsL
MPGFQQALSPSVARRRNAWLRANKPTSIAVLFSVAMVLAGILLYLWPQVHLVALGYRHSRLRTLRVQAFHKQAELQVERATLRHPSRIEEIAIQRLGMQRPHISQIIYVRPTPHPPTPGREQ